MAAKRTFTRLCGAGAMSIVALASCAAATARPLRFGVLPLQNPVSLARMFIPLCARLTHVLHRPVIFATAPDFARFMTRANAGLYDIIFLNPFLYRHVRGYRAVVRIKGLPFIGIVIVRRGSPIRTLTPKTLTGRTIAFPDRRALAATLMVKEYLRRQGVVVHRIMRPLYLRNQDSVILAVARGLADLGGTWPWSLDQEPRALQAKIRIIARTPAGPEMPIAVRDTLPPATVLAIRRALVGLSDSPAGRKVLSGLHMPAGFVAASPGEYAHIRHLVRSPVTGGQTP
ncbi:MAG: phosphate/phosphite/phosphonate ABC transporter substrate-binding protein [Gammaproteobacteria bacterium]|nr:phosphate/phosphite/phosphonate ABC transporter substrate-binding protein [Gammaproteobacteria bacterium]